MDSVVDTGGGGGASSLSSSFTAPPCAAPDQQVARDGLLLHTPPPPPPHQQLARGGLLLHTTTMHAAAHSTTAGHRPRPVGGKGRLGAARIVAVSAMAGLSQKICVAIAMDTSQTNTQTNVEPWGSSIAIASRESIPTLIPLPEHTRSIRQNAGADGGMDSGAREG